MDLTAYQQELLERLVEAQERIAAADEKRNELLEADAAERRESWAKEEARQDALIQRFELGNTDEETVSRLGTMPEAAHGPRT